MSGARSGDRGADAWDVPPAWLMVYNDGGCCRVDVADEPKLDAAVEQWVSSGETRDSLLLLTTVEGEPFKVLASTVTSWLTSTPASRARTRALEAALEREAPQEWREGDA